MEKIISHLHTSENILFNHSIKMDVIPENFKLHSHTVCELLLVKSGKVSYTVQGRKYRLKKDDLVITRPTEIHGIIPEKGTDYERYNILFNEKTMPFDVFKKIPAETDIINIGHNHILMEIFEKMDYYNKTLEGDVLDMMLTNLTKEAFVNIISEIDARHKTTEYTVTNEIVNSAMTYIDQNLLKIKNIDEISKALFVTKSHLHHLFISQLNISPKKYILSKKLVLAQRELLSGKNPTKLYEKYGFNDYSSFYRAYKNTYGISPSEKDVSKIISADKNVL